MKHMRKRKGNKKIRVVIVLSVILLALLAVTAWLEMEARLKPEELVKVQQTVPAQLQATEAPVPKESFPDESVQKAPDADHSYLIETPYVQLRFDERFVDLLGVVHTEGSPYLLEFYAILEEKPEQRLFDIAIGEGADCNLGAIETPLGIVPVDMTIYEFAPDESWNEGEITTVLAMQEVANDLMQQLMEYQTMDAYAGPAVSDEVPDSTLIKYMTIQTPYVDMQYSAAWADYLLVEEEETEDYSVQFFAQMEHREPILLFSVIFGGDHGEQVGVLLAGEDGFVTVNLLMEELDSDGMTEAEIQTLYGMQEDVNLLVESMEKFFL